MILWLTGKSGSGKTTLANELVKLGWIKLDGDDMRESINKDCDLSEQGREDNNIRIAALARVLSNQHNIVVSVIAPTNKIRKKVHSICKPHWVYVKTTKESYFDQIFEEPEFYEVCIESDLVNKEGCLKQVLKFIIDLN